MGRVFLTCVYACNRLNCLNGGGGQSVLTPKPVNPRGKQTEPQRHGYAHHDRGLWNGHLRLVGALLSEEPKSGGQGQRLSAVPEADALGAHVAGVAAAPGLPARVE